MVPTICWWGIIFIFFFQAEDGIRDIGVTGVQTCALPICFSLRIGIAFRSLQHTIEAKAERVAIFLGGKKRDRKSTRLNSSHANISYAVFCLKKKKKQKTIKLHTTQ